MKAVVRFFSLCAHELMRKTSVRENCVTSTAKSRAGTPRWNVRFDPSESGLRHKSWKTRDGGIFSLYASPNERRR